MRWSHGLSALNRTNTSSKKAGEVFLADIVALLSVVWDIYPCRTFQRQCATNMRNIANGQWCSFFSGQMHVFRPRTDLGRCLLAFVPLLCALLIAISRLDDYRHDVWDVSVGSSLGMLIAWFSYRRYYPALRSPYCDIPYDKGDHAVLDGFGKLDDEERGLPQSMSQSDSPGVAHGETYPLEEMGSSRVI